MITGAVSAQRGWQSAAAVVRRAVGTGAGRAVPWAADSGRRRAAVGEAVWLESRPSRWSGPQRLPRSRRRARFCAAGRAVRGARRASRTRATTRRGSYFTGHQGRAGRGRRVACGAGPARRRVRLVRPVARGRERALSAWVQTRGLTRSSREWSWGTPRASTRAGWRRSGGPGTAHMLSVSGLHVASLAAIMIGLARLLRAPRWAGFVLAAPSAVLMIPFVGASPPDHQVGGHDRDSAARTLGGPRARSVADPGAGRGGRSWP